jgi:hypothetical protein
MGEDKQGHSQQLYHSHASFYFLSEQLQQINIKMCKIVTVVVSCTRWAATIMKKLLISKNMPVIKYKHRRQ